MQVTPGKYRTRDGQTAVVLAVIDVTYNPVIGYVVNQGDGYTWSTCYQWETDGRLYTTFECEDDLIKRIEE